MLAFSARMQLVGRQEKNFGFKTPWDIFKATAQTSDSLISTFNNI